MTVPETVLDDLAPQPYAVLRPQIRDGDLMLCSAHDLGSRAIRWATKSVWSHVAIAFRLEELDRVLILEAVQKIGVRAVPLSDFIARNSSGTHPYPGQIIIARHRDAERAAGGGSLMRKMQEFAFDRLGAKFSDAENLKIAARIAFGRLGRLPQRLAPDDEYICSEYVAGCYESVGISIQWDGRGFIAPSNIADDPRVEAVAQIDTTGPESRS
jgi:hypothetical protein